MHAKKIYEKGKDISLKASIEIPKYLLGYDIHSSNAKQRQIIRESEDNLGKRVLKLSLNYSWEGFRQAVRYTPLVLEGVILYENVTNNLPLSTWIYTSAPIRLIEGNFMLDQKKSDRKKKSLKN